MRRLPALIAVSALLTTVGCSQVSSDKVTTADLDATILLTGDDDGIQVSVTLMQNFHTEVDLGSGDELVASAEGDEITLSGSDGHYSGRLDVAPDPGTEVTVALNRDTMDDASDSTATLPEHVQVVRPKGNLVFNPVKELTIVVDDAPGELHVTWTGSCVQTGDDVGGQATIVGSKITIPADTVKAFDASQLDCPVVFDVSRNREGNLDNAYDKGSVTGRQHVELTLKFHQRPEDFATSSASPTA